jgi:hypothetical protein
MTPLSIERRKNWVRICRQTFFLFFSQIFKVAASQNEENFFFGLPRFLYFVIFWSLQLHIRISNENFFQQLLRPDAVTVHQIVFPAESASTEIHFFSFLFLVFIAIFREHVLQTRKKIDWKK